MFSRKDRAVLAKIAKRLDKVVVGLKGTLEQQRALEQEAKARATEEDKAETKE